MTNREEVVQEWQNAIRSWTLILASSGECREEAIDYPRFLQAAATLKLTRFPYPQMVIDALPPRKECPRISEQERLLLSYEGDDKEDLLHLTPAEKRERFLRGMMLVHQVVNSGKDMNPGASPNEKQRAEGVARERN